MENIFHRFLASRLFICFLEVSFSESTISSARSIQLFCLSTTAAIPALATLWAHQDGLVQHWRPRPASAAGLMALSSIGGLAATCWMYDYHHTYYHLNVMILTQHSIADLVASSGWPCPALAASRLHAGCMIIIIPIII